MPDLKILSGGAANGLVSALERAFADRTGYGITGDFGAVGLMRDRILAGEAVDLAILSRKLIDALAASGHVAGDSVTNIGQVVTGIAVRDGAALPDVSDGGALRAVLLAADAIYLPDPEKATAGIHFAGVIKALGVADEVAGRLRPYPNGQTAMAAMAQGSDANPVGCTQITEILNTPGVTYAGDLPGEHALSTVYTAAVCSAAKAPEAAAALIALLTAPENAETRRRAGFSA